MRRRRGAGGVTLSELIVGFATFGMLLAILALALQRTSMLWNRTSSSTASQQELRKAYYLLQTDLMRSEFQTVRTTSGLTSLSGRDGDAVWFLSSVDPSTQEAMRTEHGRPFWQRNILYYLVVPEDHAQVYGMSCAGGSDPDGYEQFCPHKVLIRKVIDNPSGPGPGDDITPEELLTDVSPYLTRPRLSGGTSSAESGLDEVRLVATDLLTFRVDIAPDPRWPGELSVRLQAARIDEAASFVQLGSASLDRFLNQFTFSVFPPSEPGSS